MLAPVAVEVALKNGIEFQEEKALPGFNNSESLVFYWLGLAGKWKKTGGYDGEHQV